MPFQWKYIIINLYLFFFTYIVRSEMKYKRIVKREAHIIACIYELIHVTAKHLNIPLHALYLGEMSKILYLAYIIEKDNLWREVIQYLINEKANPSMARLMNMIKSIEVFEWENTERELNNVMSEVCSLLNRLSNEFTNLTMKIFGFREYFNYVYVIPCFSPIPELDGNLLYWDKERAVVSATFNPCLDIELIVDLIHHEVLHGLVRLNNISISHELEERIIDLLCPEGYLSELLGVSKARIGIRDEIVSYIDVYFKKRMYENTTILEYIKKTTAREFL